MKEANGFLCCGTGGGLLLEPELLVSDGHETGRLYSGEGELLSSSRWSGTGARLCELCVW